ncbi:hypothetical protein F5Y03DRAFT_46892 [Xylaria venustula]|nr:hypothetical protein F5Y03DRAFT_46892 [Xylaria venustula]
MVSSQSDHSTTAPAPASTSTSTSTSTSNPISISVPTSPPAPTDSLLSPTRFASSSRLPLPSLSQANTSSVSLVSSTAQGRPIPLSDANAADRTTALRELSRCQPMARRPHTKSSGPPPSTAATTTATTTGTYSQPVLVRTYSGPIASPARARSKSRRDAISGVQGRPGAPSSAGSRRRRRQGLAVTLMRPLVGRKPSSADDAKLPPLGDFSFKSILAEIEQDIGADLDRIADICARSRYSLSNQYEIHVAPHGSGAGFARGGPNLGSVDLPVHDNGGPTLQAISIDDEHGGSNHGRRVLVRRRSAAYGTLETIISSSRSSDEDRSKRKSAAEIAAQVRGRVPHSSPEASGSAHGTTAQASSEPHGEGTNKFPKSRPTLAAAILDHSRAQTYHSPDPQPPRTSSTSLVSEPAIPETSHSHLVSATTSEAFSREAVSIGPSAKEQNSTSVFKSTAVAAGAILEERRDQASLLGGFRFSMPWKGTSVTGFTLTDQKPGRTKSYAEGTLRQLLKITESSGSRGGKSADGEGGL